MPAPTPEGDFLPTHMKSSAMQEHFMRRLFYRGYDETITITLCLQLLDLGIK